MGSGSLTEFRCTCGKLLFKGLLLTCVVEVKCKRCGAVVTAERFAPRGYVFLESDAKGYVVAVSGDVAHLLQCDDSSLLGRQLTELFPLLRDDAPEKDALSHALKGPYTIANNILQVRDGSSVTLQSRISLRREEGAVSGHRILNWVAIDAPRE